MSGAGVALAGRGIVRRRGRGRFELDVPRIDIPAGTTLALLGPSGSGKTSLLEVLGLLERPDAGTVLYDGRPATPADREARLRMAAVFQRPYLFKGSVAGNVEYGLRARGVPRDERERRVAQALARVGLAGYERRSAAALSGGEAQRVSLARALVLKPRVLLFDEPLASLDRLLRRQLITDFATILSGEAVTVLYVTHDQDEAFVVADHIAIMNGGRIVTMGTADEIAGLAEDEWTARFLGVEKALHGSVVSAKEGLFAAMVDGQAVFATGDVAVGQDVLLSVRPEDVVLFRSEADFPVSSARNRIRMTVTDIQPEGSTLRVALGRGDIAIAASVSRAGAAELSLSPGERVLAVFKASSVRWRPVES